MCQISLTETMTPDQETFFHAFGERLTRLRKQRGLTQSKLGMILGVSQQQVVAFEKGRRRVAISALPTLARALGVSVEELVGEDQQENPRRRGPTPKLQRQLERLTRLPKSQQQFVSRMLETVLQQADE